jgi:hypothetical protein
LGLKLEDMTDLISSAADSAGDSCPISSLVNKLPGKRLDAHWRQIAADGVPEQGEVTGGYTYAYAHLSHLPLFPLITERQLQLMKEHWLKVTEGSSPQGDPQIRDEIQNPEKYAPKLSEKAALVGVKALDAAVGGVSIGTIQWFVRTVAASQMEAAKNGTQQYMQAEFKRWTLPAPQGGQWFVDILQIHCTESMNKKAKLARSASKGGQLFIKTSAPMEKASFKLLGIDVKGLKSQKMWSKKLGVSGVCEELTFVDVDSEIPMELVARMSRFCGMIEAKEMEKQFCKNWTVPVVSQQS